MEGDKLSGEGGFDHARELFAEYLVPRFAGKPTQYLEIGVYYGESAIWMMDNVLTHPDSFAELVDPWRGGDKWNTQEKMDDICRQALTNLQPYQKRCCIWRTTSERYFHEYCRHDKYDLVYIDGDHRHAPALHDGLQALRHMVPHGVIVFDDANLRNTSRAIRDVERKFAGNLTTLYESKFQKAFEVTFR